MRGVVFDGKDKVSVQNFPDPELPGDDGAIVEVKQTSICGSDLHFYWDEFGISQGIRPGHEFIGTVIEIGPDVKNIEVGDDVMVCPIFGCGHCSECSHGKPTACHDRWYNFGISHELPGGQAEAAAIPHADYTLRKIPSSMSDDQAILMTDVLPTGYCGARNADIKSGHTVVVLGLGPIGLGAALAASQFGAARVIGIDMQADRRAKAERLGCETLDPLSGHIVEQVMQLTMGRGADSVIEAVGHDSTINDAFMMAKVGGTVSVIGVSSNFELPICAPLIGPRNLTIRFGTTDVPLMWESLFPLMEAGRIDLDEVFSHRLPLSEAARGYDIFANKKEGCFKVIFDASK